MIKKLRRRFIGTTMGLVGIVMVFLFIFTMVIMFVLVTQDMQSFLRECATIDLSTYPGIDESPSGSSALVAQYLGRVCVVEVFDDGKITILEISRSNIDVGVLQTAVRTVNAGDYTFGIINSSKLFFYRIEWAHGQRIAFVDSSAYMQYLKAMFFYGGFLCLFAMFVIYLISRFLAKMMLKPVEKAWQQQKDFIADASHELKTPLTVILANNNILQMYKSDTVEHQIKWIESTQEEAMHMKELIDDLLMLAKTENMQEGKICTDIDVSFLANKIALQFEPVAYERGVNLICDIDSSIKLKGESTVINQIMHILLDNAVKYAGLGGEAQFSLKKRQNFIYLSAKNTGEPIPEADMPHLFERFYRSDKARTSGNGYGLGLSILRNLAQMMGAQVSVSSDASNGTVFTVRFRTETRKY